MKKYRLAIKYPSLQKEFEEGDMVYYNGLSNVYVRARSPHYSIDVNEVENNPDFWEEVKQPLFVTEDGVEINKNYGGWLYRISKDFKREVLPISPEMEVEGYKVFDHPENADKYIEEHKPKPLFTTDDGVEISDLCQTVYLIHPKTFIRQKSDLGYFSADDLDNNKLFFHESNADEYTWKNKRVFSYEDIYNYLKTTPLFDIERMNIVEQWIRELAKERVCNG